VGGKGYLVDKGKIARFPEEEKAQEASQPRSPRSVTDPPLKF
jgi:hypothetical protein